MELSDLLEFVNSFHAKILEVATEVETIHEVSEEFRKDWENSIQDLRERLAKEKSFRKKDFNQIISKISELQNGQEKNIRATLCHYIDIQKKFSEDLKTIIFTVEKAKSDNDVNTIQECLHSFNQIREEIEGKEVLFKKDLESYLSQQRQVSQTFQTLQKNNGKIYPRDFKTTVLVLLASLENGPRNTKDKKEAA